MKATKLFLAMLATAFVATACDPIEDESLRDAYASGTPISKAELAAALTITQPYPNQDGVVEGDQYVTLKNARTDIGGSWYLQKGASKKTVASNNATVVLDQNGEWQIYYAGISEDQIVQTDPVTITVTNVFDDWANLFTGAENKADASAMKTWRFNQVGEGGAYVCHNGAYAAWNYYDPENKGICWWGGVTLESTGDMKMEFKYDQFQLITYGVDGSQLNKGSFNFTHNEAVKGVIGELKTDIPLIGSQWDECRGHKNDGSENVFWLLRLEADRMAIYHPDDYSGGAEWGNCGWYAFYKADPE